MYSFMSALQICHAHFPASNSSFCHRAGTVCNQRDQWSLRSSRFNSSKKGVGAQLESLCRFPSPHSTKVPGSPAATVSRRWVGGRRASGQCFSANRDQSQRQHVPGPQQTSTFPVGNLSVMGDRSRELALADSLGGPTPAIPVGNLFGEQIAGACSC